MLSRYKIKPSPLHIVRDEKAHPAFPKLRSSPGQSSQPKSTLFIPALQGYDSVSITDIIYLQAQSNYTFIYTQSGSTFCYSKVLKQVMAKITAPHFFRVHQSYFINTDQIDQIQQENTNLSCVMSNKTIIPISRRKKKEFKAWMTNH